MTRFAFLFLVLLLIAGCRTAAHSPQKTILVHHQNTAKQFWHRTAQFFQPLMPDTGTHSGEAESQWASNRTHTHSHFLPINHTPHSLYKPDTIFPSPRLAFQKPEDTLLTVAAATSAIAAENPLKIQNGDSEAFQSLLREIAIVPAERRNVDEVKLSELLTSFRSDASDGVMDAGFEEEYLALLRRRILPAMATSQTAGTRTETFPSAAPLPEAELAGTQRPARPQQFERQIEWANEDDYDYEPIIAQRTMPMNRAPMNMAAVNRTAMNRTSGNRAEQPDYPDLAQLPHASPGVVQMSYQNQGSPASAMSGFGAGDWQTPMRHAVEQLRYAIEHTPHGRSVSNEMRLRLLETVLGNKSEAARPMQSADETTNRFMGNQVLGFAALLDDTTQDSRGKHIAAAFRFNEGLIDLQNLCPLRLKNATFVRECFGYGQFIPHPGEFHPGDRFHVYVEIENPTVHRTDMFQTSMVIGYEIYDDRANIVLKEERTQSAGENSLSRKRDYFEIVRGVLPASIPPGQYYLLINVIDLNDTSMQHVVERLDFRVVPSMGGEM